MNRSENERFCSTGSRGLLPRRGDESPLLPGLQGPQPAVVPSSNRRTPIATGLVRFRVGKEPEVQEFDAQKEVLANANEVLFASFNGYMPDSSEEVICISDADPRAFENFLRFLERKDVNFRSTTTAVLTLYVAIKYLEPRLAIHCLNYLNNKLSTESVLELLVYNSLLCHDHRGSNGMLYESNPGSPIFGDHATQTSPLSSPYHNAYLPPHSFEDGSSSPPCLEDSVMAQQNEANGRLVSGSRGSIRSIRPSPSAPPDSAVNFKKDDDMKTMWRKAAYLQHNCYQWVDCNADDILSSETAESFDEQLLSHIISRPTLGVSSETKVVDLLKRWSTSECRRKGLAVTHENLMLCLGDLRFKARYLQMEADEFLHGYKCTKGSQVKNGQLSSPMECTPPAFSGLLTQEESHWILDRITRPHRGLSAAQDCIKPLPEPPSLAPWISSMECARDPPARDFLTLEGKPVSSKDGKSKRKGGSSESSTVRSKLRAALTLGWRKSRGEKRRREEVTVVKEKTRNAEDSGRKRSKDSGTGRRCSGSCFAEYFFTALSCFFD